MVGNYANSINYVLEVIYRMPSLFYLHKFQSSDRNSHFRGMKLSNEVTKFIGNNFFIPTNSEEPLFDFSYLTNSVVFSLIVNYLCFFSFFFIAFLSVKKIVSIYKHIVCTLLVFFGGLLSHDFVLKCEFIGSGELPPSNSSLLTERILKSIAFPYNLVKHLPYIHGKDPILLDIVINTLCQFIIASCITHLLSLKWPGRMSMLAFLCPVVMKLIKVDNISPRVVHNVAAYLVLISCFMYCLDNIGSILATVKKLCNFMILLFVRFGWLEAPFQLWNQYKLSAQLLVLWSSIFAMTLYDLLSDIGLGKDGQEDGSGSLILIRAISETCSSPLTVLAMCIVVCYLSSAVLTLTKVFLLGMEGFRQDTDLNHGWTEGITLLLVVVQTNMTELNTSERRYLMVIVLFIILSTLLESIHDILNPHLLDLAASFNKSLFKHLRAIFLATCLWICPIYMTLFLSRLFTVGFWLMIIISSCLLTTIQVISTLLIYAIFIYDHLRAEPSDKIDDAIFYIKTAVRCIEFLVALTVVTFGSKEIIEGNWSIISTIILGVHFYFNVWKRIQAGWESYNMRRAALRRLEVLPEADEAELATLNDVCPICHCEMKSARKTECHHYFHAYCLRKWLYIRDYCPMCQRKINLPAHEEEVKPNVSDNIEQNDDDAPFEDYSPSTSDSEIYDDDNVDLGVYLDDYDYHEQSSGDEVSDIDNPNANRRN